LVGGAILPVTEPRVSPDDLHIEAGVTDRGPDRLRGAQRGKDGKRNRDRDASRSGEAGRDPEQVLLRDADVVKPRREGVAEPPRPRGARYVRIQNHQAVLFGRERDQFVNQRFARIGELWLGHDSSSGRARRPSA
jgi:hypothetical protein